MNLQELISHANTGGVEELNLISIEGGIYLLEARMRGVAHRLVDAQNKALHLRSVEHARELLQPVAPIPFNLVHAVVHDEMCGVSDDLNQDVKIPLAFRSAW